MFNKIAVIGMGYVGIPTAAVFAETGMKVFGLQRRSPRSAHKIEMLNKGISPLKGKEPGLNELIEKVVKEGNLEATDDFSVCKEVDAILIAVQTPTDENHIPQYESLKEVCNKIGPLLSKDVLVCNESTIAPGTMEYIVKPILEVTSAKKAGEDFYLAYSYERVMVGRLIYNIKNYPRVIGGINPASSDRTEELYRMITEQPLHKTDCMTAEVSKTVENTYRDINIAFANEVALICESLGINAFEVRKLVNTLPMNSNAYRNLHVPGAGVGGHCLPKDPWLLKYGLDTYGKIKVDPKILTIARAVNVNMPVHLSEKMFEALKVKNVSPSEAKVVIMGMAFLENTDDTRNSPTVDLIKAMENLGMVSNTVHDPYVESYEDINLTADLMSALEGADCAVIVTKHDDYKELDLEAVKSKMRTPIIIDGRNAFERSVIESAGFYYDAIGKGKNK